MHIGCVRANMVNVSDNASESKPMTDTTQRQNALVCIMYMLN